VDVFGYCATKQVRLRARELDLDIVRAQTPLRSVLLSAIGLRVTTTGFFFITGLGYTDPLGVPSAFWVAFGLTMMALGVLSVARGPFRLTARIDELNSALRCASAFAETPFWRHSSILKTPTIYQDRLGTSTLRKGGNGNQKGRPLPFCINAGSWRRTGRQEVARRELEGTWKGGGGGVMIMLLMGRLALLLESRGCRECSG
jgi:hypothetical protein